MTGGAKILHPAGWAPANRPARSSAAAAGQIVYVGNLLDHPGKIELDATTIKRV